MAYDDALAERIRDVLSDEAVVEKKMFGGLCFMYQGNMVCGVVKTELCARVGKGGYEDALAQEHARPMDFTGRPLRGMVYVSTDGVEDDVQLAEWVERCMVNARSLPAK